MVIDAKAYDEATVAEKLTVKRQPQEHKASNSFGNMID